MKKIIVFFGLMFFACTHMVHANISYDLYPIVTEVQELQDIRPDVVYVSNGVDRKEMRLLRKVFFIVRDRVILMYKDNKIDYYQMQDIISDMKNLEIAYNNYFATLKLKDTNSALYNKDSLIPERDRIRRVFAQLKQNIQGQYRSFDKSNRFKTDTKVTKIRFIRLKDHNDN